MINSNKLCLLSLLFCINGCQVAKSEANWILSFTNYIKTNANVQQVVILIDENGREGSFGPSEMFWKAFAGLPSREIDFKEATIANARRLVQSPSFVNPQTSLFVTIQSQLDNQSQSRLAKVHDFLGELSQNRKRPKYLIIFFREKNNQTYENLLQELWSKQFLDATVLEILKPRPGKRDSLDHHQEILEEIARTYYFNPFTKTLSSGEIDQNLGFFPDKLANMHGYEVKIAFINQPPDVYINHNESTQTASGVLYLKLKALSEAMNFVIRIPRNITDVGKFSCSKTGNTGMTRSLKNNEVHLSAVEFGRFVECDNSLFEWCGGISSADFCLVVPVLQDEANQLKTTWNILSVIVVLSMPLILWITSRILKFDKRNWRPEYMVEIVFGFSVPREPDKEAERFFFAAALWAYFLYSSVIYTGLTSISVNHNTTRFHNIDEVINSDLEILVRPLIYDLSYSTSDGSVKDLLDKAKQVVQRDEECIDRLLKYKNVACIIMENLAKLLLRKEKDICGRPVAKIMDEDIKKTVSNTVLEPGSPFVNKIGQLIHLFHQAGLVDKWWQDYDFLESSKNLDTSISCTTTKSELAFIMKHLMAFVGFGYACSIIVFFLELMTSFLRKKLLHVL